MICSECKSKFKFIERIKSMNRRKGRIQCGNCKSTFVIKGNSGRITNSIVSGIVVFISTFIGLSFLVEGNLENKVVGSILIGILIAGILVSYYFISQNWWKYEIINEDSKKEI
ncbi:MAG: hypothetical protein ACRDAU_09665 [Clostridium sp.]